MGSWPLNGKKGGNRKHSKIDTLPPEMKATVEEMIMDGSATYSDIVAYLEQQGFEVTYLSVDSQGHISLEELEAAIRPDTILADRAGKLPQYAG